MEMISVDSSNIARIGYDDDSATLGVEFLSGSSYQYFDVPSSVFEAFMSSASKGSFLHSNIRGIYRYSRI